MSASTFDSYHVHNAHLHGLMHNNPSSHHLQQSQSRAQNLSRTSNNNGGSNWQQTPHTKNLITNPPAQTPHLPSQHQPSAATLLQQKQARQRLSNRPRPDSLIQQLPIQPVNSSIHMNDASQKRLSIYPQHNNSARPTSTNSHIQPPLTRVSTGSTVSSNSNYLAQPPPMTSGPLHHNMYPSHPPPMNMNRRTPSTSSNVSGSPNASVRRSSSSRSSNNVSSYVALLRKQKATVWCDRSQAEDPRIMAAQRLAKERAEREVAALPGQSSQAHHLHGSAGSTGAAGPAGAKRTPPNSTAGSFTTGVARKIRHHGAQKATTYAGGNMAGAGVPMRLSATEIDDDEEEGAGERLGSLRNPMDDMDWDAQFYGVASSSRGSHARTASGQSRGGGQIGGLPGRTGTMGSTPPGGSPGETTPGPNNSKDYFSKKQTDGGPSDKAKEDELRRRGSVDERAMTMTSGRLFVANPDMDSD